MRKRVQCDARDEHQLDAVKSSNSSELCERSKLIKFIGKIIIFLTLMSSLFVGILVNICQLILIITIRLSDNPRWRKLHKRLNSCLVYLLFSPYICLLYHWSDASLRIHLGDTQLLEWAKKSMLGIMIPNHSYTLDYMVCFLLADQLGGVGCYKSMSKEELKYLPIIGWAMWMSDIIFVKRDWKQDREIIADKLDALFDYDQTILGIFAEGTRFSPEKYQQSVEFAQSRDIEPLKYHLIPRSRGFNYIVRHYLREIVLKGRASEDQFKLFNLQIVMPDKPTFRDFFEGRQMRADVYCEEVKLSAEIRREVINSSSEDDCPQLSKLLMEIYRRKDQLVDEYYRNGGNFKIDSDNGGLFPYRKRLLSFFLWLAGFCLTYGSLGYLAIINRGGSSMFWLSLVGFVVACFLMLKRIARDSKIPRSNKSQHQPKSMNGLKLSKESGTQAQADITTSCPAC